MSPEEGALGVTGPDSYHWHVIQIILAVIQTIDSTIKVYLIIENAGSMKIGRRCALTGANEPNHKEYMRIGVGLPPGGVKYMSAGERGGAVARNRTFFVSCEGIGEVVNCPCPWDEGWSQPYGENKNKVVAFRPLIPWLRPRGFTANLSPKYTSGAYHPFNLLSKIDSFQDKETFITSWLRPKEFFKELMEKFVPEQ